MALSLRSRANSARAKFFIARADRAYPRAMRNLLIPIALLLPSCATTMNDSAPAPQPGMVFVVGSKANRPQIWLCPNQPGKGDCVEIDTEVSE